MRPIALFTGQHLQATLFRPRRSKLFVSFRQRIGDPGDFDPARAVMGFTRRGYAHLHLQSRQNDWFINPDTEALETELARLSDRYEEVVAIGFSMGGYGALRFAGALRLTRVLSISPQVGIDPAQVPFDVRYRKEARGWDAALGDLTDRGTDVAGVVLADPFKRADLRHGRMICEVFPRLTLVQLPFGGHPATRVLRQGGQLDWLRLQLIEGFPDPAAITRVHRSCRAQSPSYWSSLAETAHWHGRETLALAAELRAETLADKA